MGITLCAVSALLIFGRNLRIRMFAGAFAAACTIPAVAVYFVVDLPIDFRWQALIAIASGILAALVRSSDLTSALAKSASFLRKPVISGGLVLFAGIGVVAYACYQSEPASADDWEQMARDLESETARDYQPAEGLQATTDLGNQVLLLRITNAKAEALTRSDERLLQNQAHRDYLIRVAGPSAQTNCHGWVFTGGLCWIRPEAVEVILVENAYQQVEVPVAGDVVVYRDELGKITHTGIVRAVWSEGRILVESKWGTLGAFIHFVERSVYSGHWTFHHAQRPAHLLRGLPESGGLATIANQKRL